MVPADWRLQRVERSGASCRKPQRRAWRAALSAVLLAWTGLEAAFTGGGPAAAHGSRRASGGRRAPVHRAAEGQTEVVSRSWREATEAARSYEQQLNWVRLNASAAVRELELAFQRNGTIGQDAYPRPPRRERRKGDNMTDADLLGLTDLFEGPEQQPELVVPNIEETPPVLAGEWSTGKALKGMFSSSSELELPSRQYGAQFLSGAGDDPVASQEENELWREALFLVTPTLDPLYTQSEETVAKVRAAEELAEMRRGPIIEDFRQRVLQQMNYAEDELFPMEMLSEWLTVLQTDKRLLRYLALLERSALRAEDLQTQIQMGQEAIAKLPEDSRDRQRAAESVQRVYGETRGLDIRIRSCIRAARELPGQLDAEEQFKEQWDNINPFKNLFR